ncbi:hypothetical protein BDQ12DRAFT_699597 [Crucibulum laeve]|uniref:Nephrocystin 3-like N-terminal domain-containing protein n=1 Tax=Crucibulum laeve TaxID=68775 RepID=A0A5C3M604_9AGAR|nr:hypothetical protein BDQ12DRAFT_699597 [Crucibulum laeve]
MFNDSHHFSISGGTFSNIQVDTTVDKSAKNLRILQQATAPGASHDSAERYPPPKCHPKTREAILNTILVLWLYGPAGAGKSAIAQTAAEICRDKKWLAASFFFSRSSKDRNTEHHLVATLAYQLAIAIPEAKDVILKVVEEDPSIFFKSVEVQAKELLLSPISKAYHGADPKKWPKLVIIDGLDECTGHEMQCRILRIIYEVLSKDFPFCVLVCSRPEPVIRDEFLASELGEITQKLALDDSYQARADIFVFLSSGFDKIHDKHQRLGTMTHVSKPWPPIHTIDALVFKSSGHFIYAATVLKFVDNPRAHVSQ